MEERIQILLKHITDEKSSSKSISNEIETILSDFNINEISLLDKLSQKLKINQNNIDKILDKSKRFESLKESCLLYKDIIDNSSIKQKNFVNILILDHLLLNITEQNVEKYAIYANLFLSDMDIKSMYQIIVTHCFGRLNSIYSITLFWKKLIEIHKSDEMIPDILYKNWKSQYGKWELSKIEYFLHHFGTFVKIQPNLIQRVIKKKHNNFQKFFEKVKNNEVSNRLFKSIQDDNIEEFQTIFTDKNLNANCSIISSQETSNYWPFNFKDKIKFIELAAFTKSIKVFKFLILNHATIEDDLINYAIAGGNAEIIRICQQQKCEISPQSFENAIRYYQNDIFIWLIEQNRELFNDKIDIMVYHSIFYSNPQALLIILDNNEFCFDHFIPNKLYFYEDEWKTFLFTIQAFENNINKAINDHDFYYFVKLDLHSLQQYLENKGELEKYKNELLLPPYPNKLVLSVDKSPYYQFMLYTADYSEQFIVYLSKNAFISSFLHSTFSKICRNRIRAGDIDLLYEIEKYNPSVIQQVYDGIFNNNWMNIMRNDFYVSLYNKIEINKFFIDRCIKDIESNIDFQTEGLYYSCFYGKYDFVVEFLHRKYIDVNSRKYFSKQTPLILAARCGYTLIVHHLIKDERIDVNLSCDEKHQTPFYYACEDNYVELVELLLKDERVDINLANNEGKTPFLIACEKGYYKIVKLLLQRKDLELKANYKKGSPFNLAVANWHYKIVQLLIDKGLTIQNENDQNPLQIACLSGNLKMVKLLFSIDSEKLSKNDIDNEGILYLLF